MWIVDGPTTALFGGSLRASCAGGGVVDNVAVAGLTQSLITSPTAVGAAVVAASNVPMNNQASTLFSQMPANEVRLTSCTLLASGALVSYY